MNGPANVTVAVKPAMSSKINWTAIISVLAMTFSFFGLNISPELQAGIIAAIGVVSQLMQIIFKTWFTNTVTPSSIK